MAEVPEYLLQRSRERRAALGLAPSGGGEAPAPAAPAEGGEAGAPAAATPATTEAAAPATTAPAAAPAVPEPEPEPVYFEPPAARSGIPAWVVPVLALLPILIGGARTHADPAGRPGLRQELQPLPRRPGRRRRRAQAGRWRGQADVPQRGRPHRLGQHRLGTPQGPALRRPGPDGRPARRQDRRHAAVQGHPLGHRDQERRELRERRIEVTERRRAQLDGGRSKENSAAAGGSIGGGRR